MYGTLHANNFTHLFRAACGESCDKSAGCTDLPSQWYDANLQFVTEATTKIPFWKVAPCRLLNIYQSTRRNIPEAPNIGGMIFLGRSGKIAEGDY